MRTRRGTEERETLHAFFFQIPMVETFLDVYYQPRVYKPVNNNPKRVSILLKLASPPDENGRFGFLLNI